jgi:hypothetical protein
LTRIDPDILNSDQIIILAGINVVVSIAKYFR